MLYYVIQEQTIVIVDRGKIFENQNDCRPDFFFMMRIKLVNNIFYAYAINGYP